MTLKPPMGQERLVERPFQRNFIDVLGPYPRLTAGNGCIFTVLDHLSKFVLVKPMRKATSKHVIKFLISEVFHKFSTPETIVSNNEKQFISKEFADMAKNFCIRHTKTAIYSPQANASERANQSRDNHLSEIEYSLRSSVNTTIGVTPHFALFGSNMLGHESVYHLTRQLRLPKEAEAKLLPKKVKTEIVRRHLRGNLHIARASLKTIITPNLPVNLYCRNIKPVGNTLISSRICKASR